MNRREVRVVRHPLPGGGLSLQTINDIETGNPKTAGALEIVTDGTAAE